VVLVQSWDRLAGDRSAADGAPFYHCGRHEILPVGSKLPRRGKIVRVVFGGPINCNDDFLCQVAAVAGSHDLGSPALWEALASRAYEALRKLDILVHPAAGAAEY
jgi:hypothetical protein